MKRKKVTIKTRFSLEEKDVLNGATGTLTGLD